MAVVYRAYQPNIRREVALKILPRVYAADQTFVNYFEQEARVIASLEHTHILPVYDFGEAGGYTYIAMRLVPGGTLSNRLRGKPLSPIQIRRVTSQIGDVKPSNILVDHRRDYLLADFGIAKIVKATTRMTQTGVTIGTPAYMSPEQFRSKAVDGRSDVYSLGVVLYEMATGRVPYRGRKPAAVHVQQLHDKLPPPRTLNPALPEAVEQVIVKALAKRPEDRFQTACDMVRALRAVTPDTAPVQPTPKNQDQATVRTRGTRKPVKLPPQPGPVDSPPRRPVNFRWIVAAVGMVLAAGIVLTGLAGWLAYPLITGKLPASPTRPAAETSPAPGASPEEPAVATPPAEPSAPVDTPAGATGVPPSQPSTPPAPTDTPASMVIAITSPMPEALALNPTPEAAASLDLPGRLALPLMLGNEPKVYIVDTNGELLGDLGAACQPDYTRDGAKLIVNGERGAWDKLRVTDPVGDLPIQIGDPGLNGHSHPCWSPDGTQVVFDDQTIDPAGWRIFFQGLNNTSGPGTMLRAGIGGGEIIGQNPLWTTQDRFIFRGCNTWEAGQRGKCGIWVMQGNGGTPVRLTSNPNHIPTDVDGDMAVYETNETGDWNVYSLNIGTGESTQLTFDPMADGLAAISPGGNVVAFVSNRQNRLAVWATYLTGNTPPEKLFDIPPEWGQLSSDSWFEEGLAWGAP